MTDKERVEAKERRILHFNKRVKERLPEYSLREIKNHIKKCVLSKNYFLINNDKEIYPNSIRIVIIYKSNKIYLTLDKRTGEYITIYRRKLDFKK